MTIGPRNWLAEVIQVDQDYKEGHIGRSALSMEEKTLRVPTESIFAVTERAAMFDFAMIAVDAEVDAEVDVK